MPLSTGERDTRWQQDGVQPLPLPAGMSQLTMRGGQQLAGPQPGDDVELYTDDGTGKGKGQWVGGYMALSCVEQGEVGGPYDGEDVVFVGKAGQDLDGESVDGDEWPADMLRLAKGQKTPFAPPEQDPEKQPKQGPVNVASFAYDASEMRDYHGRWSSTGGGGPATATVVPTTPHKPTRDELEKEWFGYNQAERMALAAGTAGDPAQPTPYVNGVIARRVDKENAGIGYVLNAAFYRGMGVKEYVAAAHEHLVNLLKSARLVKRTHLSTLGQILADGRIKTQYETGASSGLLDTDMRMRAERDLFTTPRKTPPEKRPVYAYMTDYPDDPRVDTMAMDDPLSDYGTVDIVFKDSLKERTTFVGSDSLGLPFTSTGVPDVWPSAMTDPSFHSLQQEGTDVFDVQHIQDYPTDGYWETQIHGGTPTVKDIDYVVLPDYSSYSSETRVKANATIEALKKAGVHYVIRGAGTKASFSQTVPYATFMFAPDMQHAYNPQELRDWHGRWTAGGGQSVGARAASAGEGPGAGVAPYPEGITPKQWTAADKVLARYGVSKEIYITNLRKRAALLDPVASKAWARWYFNANQLASNIAGQADVSITAASIALAALSPKAPWGMPGGNLVLKKGEHKGVTVGKWRVANQVIARKICMLAGKRANEQYTITQEMADELNDSEKGKKYRIDVVHYNGRDPNFQQGADYSGTHAIKDIPADILIDVMRPELHAMSDSGINALIGARTEDPEILGGPKTRSFYNNIRFPGQSDDDTIDVHMVRILTNRLDLYDDEVGDLTKNAAVYKTASDAVASVAHEMGWQPHELQAALWEQQHQGYMHTLTDDVKKAIIARQENQNKERIASGLEPLVFAPEEGGTQQGMSIADAAPRKIKFLEKKAKDKAKADAKKAKDKAKGKMVSDEDTADDEEEGGDDA